MTHSTRPLDNHSTQYPSNYDNLGNINHPISDSQNRLDSSDNHLYDNSTPAPANAPLRVHVERVVREYFAALDDEMPTDFYELILKEVELPLLTVVLEQTRGNQTKCAQILGLNRGTLRKKLKTYNLM